MSKMEKALESCFETNLGLDIPIDARFPRVIEDGSHLRYYDSHDDGDARLYNGVYIREDGGYRIRSHGNYKKMRLVADDVICDDLKEVFVELMQRSYFQCGDIDQIHLRLREMFAPVEWGGGPYPIPKNEVYRLLETIETSPELIERVAKLKVYGI